MATSISFPVAPLFTALLNGMPLMRREWVRCSADLNARNALGETPLRLAVETSGTYSLVSPLLAKFFIEAGADINAYDNGGYTVFHEASKAIDLAPGHHESQEIIAMLQKRKA